MALQKAGVHRPKHGAISCVHGDRGMQQKAVLTAVIAQGGAVLDRQNMPPARPLRGAGGGGGRHLLMRDARIVQKARQPDFARAATAELANRRPALPYLDEPRQTQGPDVGQTEVAKLPQTLFHPANSLRT